MRVFYEQKIQEVCGAFRFPHKIQVDMDLFMYVLLMHLVAM